MKSNQIAKLAIIALLCDESNHTLSDQGRTPKVIQMGLPKGSRLLKRFARQQNPPKPKRRNSNPELPF